MGSEQSNHAQGSGIGTRRHQGKSRDRQRARSSSPRPSINSDSDIPYISYTVNRPIGDSPKLLAKGPGHNPHGSVVPFYSKVRRPKSFSGSISGHDIIVVKEGASQMDELETDSELIKLRSIPSFHPIMRGALNIPTISDPDVLDKLDYQVVLDLCLRYQQHLSRCCEVVSSEQNSLAERIREIDFAISTLKNVLMERQKKFVKYAEHLSKVQEMSVTLKRCQVRFSEVVNSMEVLNNMLPPEDRLEPFVMLTG